MLLRIVNIVAGLLLAAGIWGTIPGIGPSVEDFAKKLAPYQVIIGSVGLVLGILNFFGLQGIVAIAASLVLLLGVLPMIPAVGKNLENIAKFLVPFQTIIGIAALVIGLLG